MFNSFLNKEMGGIGITGMYRQGTASAVFHAVDQEGSARAIKVLHKPTLSLDKKGKEVVKLFDVLSQMRDISHPNIARIFDFGEDDLFVWTIMEWVEGNSLREYLQQPSLPLPFALDIVAQILEALEEFERWHLTHGNLKPENILITQEQRVKLTDHAMGIQIKRHAQDETIKNADAHYLSPDQILEKKLDIRSDLYNLGVVFYEMIARTPPYTGHYPFIILQHHITAPVPSVRSQFPDIPAEVEAWISKLLAKSPEGRFESPSVLKEQILEFQSLQMERTRPKSPEESPMDGLAETNGSLLDVAFEDAFQHIENVKEKGLSPLPLEGETKGTPEETPPERSAPEPISAESIPAESIPSSQEEGQKEPDTRPSGRIKRGRTLELAQQDFGKKKRFQIKRETRSFTRIKTEEGGEPGPSEPLETDVPQSEVFVEPSHSPTPEIPREKNVSLPFEPVRFSEMAPLVPPQPLDEVVSPDLQEPKDLPFQPAIFHEYRPAPDESWLMGGSDFSNASQPPPPPSPYYQEEQMTGFVEGYGLPSDSFQTPHEEEEEGVIFDEEPKINQSSIPTPVFGNPAISDSAYGAPAVPPLYAQVPPPIYGTPAHGMPMIPSLGTPPYGTSVPPPIYAGQAVPPAYGIPTATPAPASRMNQELKKTAKLELPSRKNLRQTESHNVSKLRKARKRKTRGVALFFFVLLLSPFAYVYFLQPKEEWASRITEFLPFLKRESTPIIENKVEPIPPTNIAPDILKNPSLGWFGEKLVPDLKRLEQRGEYVWERDKSILVYVPAGPFWYGDPSKPESLQKMDIPSYYIDKYELTNNQYLDFMQSTGYEASSYISKPGFNATRQPVVGINWKDASMYAKWSGKRLPTEMEWEKAARGGFQIPNWHNKKLPVEMEENPFSKRIYPWGDDAPMSDDYKTRRANYRVSDPKYDISKPTEVGSFELGISPYGCYDMAGNVWEWCSDDQEKQPKPSSKLRKACRGGSWGSTTVLCFRSIYTDAEIKTNTMGVRFAR